MRGNSFSNILQQKNDKIEEDSFLFTKLVSHKNIHQSTTSLSSSNNEQQINQMFSKFQILKLDKANLIADIHLKTGQPVKKILTYVLQNLQNDIYTIISNCEEIKESKCMHSTVGFTEYSSLGNSQNKMIQFTLGNKENSAKSENSLKEQGNSVSQFSTRIAASKRIKQKLMGIQ